MSTRSEDMLSKNPKTNKLSYQITKPTPQFPHFGIILQDEFLRDTDENQFKKVLKILTRSKIRRLFWFSGGEFTNFPEKCNQIIETIADSTTLFHLSTNVYEHMTEKQYCNFSNALIKNKSIIELRLQAEWAVIPSKCFDMLMIAIASMQRLTSFRFPMNFKHHSAKSISLFYQAIGSNPKLTCLDLNYLYQADPAIVPFILDVIKKHLNIKELDFEYTGTLESLIACPKITTLRLNSGFYIFGTNNRGEFTAFLSALTKNKNIINLKVGRLVFSGWFSYSVEMQSFLEALKANPKLQSLEFDNLNVKDFDQKTILLLSEYLEKSALIKFAVRLCELANQQDEQWQMIFRGLLHNTSLRYLSLKGSDMHTMQPRMFNIFLDFLAENRRITSLDLSGTQIEKWSEERYMLFINALNQNGTLKEFICDPLHLEEHSLYDERIKQIQKIIKENTMNFKDIGGSSLGKDSAIAEKDLSDVVDSALSQEHLSPLLFMTRRKYFGADNDRMGNLSHQAVDANDLKEKELTSEFEIELEELSKLTEKSPLL